MGFFSKSKKDGDNQRQHTRHNPKGETLTMVDDGTDTSRPYIIKDVSIGGLALSDYDGDLCGGQYFEFKLTMPKNEDETSIDGFANVIRVQNGMLAAQFSPQPRLKKILRKYLG